MALIHFYHFKLLKAVNKLAIFFVFFTFYITISTFYVIFFHSYVIFSLSLERRDFAKIMIVMINLLKGDNPMSRKESETIILNTLRIGVA